jgi:hypothetical protein
VSEFEIDESQLATKELLKRQRKAAYEMKKARAKANKAEAKAAAKEEKARLRAERDRELWVALKSASQLDND